MEKGYCTIVSKYRLYQGLALYNSLSSNSKDFMLFILCMDEETYKVLKKMKLSAIVPIALRSMETPEVQNVKNQRSVSEYCYTLKPIFIKYVFSNYQDIHRVTYLDADLYFFADPNIIFDKQEYCSVLLSRHDYSFNDIKKDSEKYGKYNSGLISFKRDKIAVVVLDWWEDCCIEWCFDKVLDDKFTDQKYLERMPLIFNGVGEIIVPGVNIAFWNHYEYNFSVKDNEYYVNENKLICYHFSLFRMVSKYRYALGYANYVYLPMMHIIYGLAVHEAVRMVQSAVPGFNGFFLEENLKGKEQAKYYNVINYKKDWYEKLKEQFPKRNN